LKSSFNKSTFFGDLCASEKKRRIHLKGKYAQNSFFGWVFL
jgi:hypothetical protein